MNVRAPRPQRRAQSSVGSVAGGVGAPVVALFPASAAGSRGPGGERRANRAVVDALLNGLGHHRRNRGRRIFHGGPGDIPIREKARRVCCPERCGACADESRKRSLQTHSRIGTVTNDERQLREESAEAVQPGATSLSGEAGAATGAVPGKRGSEVRCGRTRESDADEGGRPTYRSFFAVDSSANALAPQP